MLVNGCQNFSNWRLHVRRRTFSHGSSILSTKVLSNHMRWRQRKTLRLDASLGGGLVARWSGFGAGRTRGGGSVAMCGDGGSQKLKWRVSLENGYLNEKRGVK